jgi:hypothetical protein
MANLSAYQKEISMAFDRSEVIKLEGYLKRKFGNHGISLRARPSADSVEVLLNGEFMGVIYKDEDDGEVSYDFNMAILAIDVNE